MGVGHSARTRAGGLSATPPSRHPVWHAGAVSSFQIKFVGPAAMAVQVATLLADAEGVELTSSHPPVVKGPERVELDVEVEGSKTDVTTALAAIRTTMPSGSSIDVVGY